MCGIIGRAWHKPIDGKDAKEVIHEMYRKQSHRGHEGSGCIVVKNDNTIAVSQDDSIMDTLATISDCEYAKAVVFHHRFPTSTDNVAPCSHPIKVSHKKHKHDYYVIHNGIISNTCKLRTQHNTEGYIYSTEHVQSEETHYNFKDGTSYVSKSESTKWNDSESVAIELAKLLEGKTTTLDQVTGSYALIAVQVNRKSKKATNIFYYRNDGNPTKIGEGLLTLSSEGVGDDTRPGVLYAFNLLTHETVKSVIHDIEVKSVTPYGSYKVGFYTGDDDDDFDYTNATVGDLVGKDIQYDTDDTMSDEDYLDWLYEQYRKEKKKDRKKALLDDIREAEAEMLAKE